MAKYAYKVVEQAQAWVGLKEKDGSHKEIIDVYNAHKPLARQYKVKCKANGDDKNEDWCATFVSAVAAKLGYTDIIPTECSCPKMIDLLKGIGCWHEDESVTPAIGWILFYHWNDKKDGEGDCKGQANHVGLVEKVSGGKVTIIEGNYSDSVKRRTLKINAQYMRGYGVPKYDMPDQKVTVLDFQKAAIADGFKFPKAGADGIWGSETEGVTQKAVVKKRLTYKYKNCTKLVQKVCGVEVDGYCGKDTDKAIRTWQRLHGLKEDGAFGPACWKKLLT